MSLWGRLRCLLGRSCRRPYDPRRDPLVRDLRRQAAIAEGQAEAIREARRQGRYPSWEDILGVRVPPREEGGRRG